VSATFSPPPPLLILTILVNICGGRSYCDAKNIIIPVLVSLKAETRMLTQKSALEQAAVQLAHVGGGRGRGGARVLC